MRSYSPQAAGSRRARHEDAGHQKSNKLCGGVGGGGGGGVCINNTKINSLFQEVCFKKSVKSVLSRC